MKVLGVVLGLLAILVGVVPQFADCQSQGLMLTLEGGRQVAMKCHWTALAEISLAVPIFVLGLLLFFTRGHEARLVLGILGILLGAFVILLPTYLVGVCTSLEHLCNVLMKPFLILSGSLVIGISLAVTVSALRERKRIASGLSG